MNFIRTSCIRIPLQLEGESWFPIVKQSLTRVSSSYEDPSIKQTTLFYDVRDGHLLIPRYYPIENFGHDALTYLPEGKNISFQFKTQWRNDLQADGYNMLISQDRGILSLPPGEGKTVVAIGAICKIGKKAIIFVHKDSLVNQWKDRFIMHSTVTESDIGLLETADCQGILDKPIVITTVQTMLSMIKRLPYIEKVLLDANFGVSIWDECHTSTGAEMYSKTSLYLPCKRTFGLSATPERADQNHDIIGMHLGMVYKPEGKSKTLDPRILMVHFDHKAVAYHKQYIYWGIPDRNGNHKLKYPRFDLPRYLAMLTSKKNDEYIKKMRQIVKYVHERKRNTLFIADRIKILDLCSKVIPNRNDVGFFIPRSGDQRDSDLLKPFVFSTPGSSRDGTDKEAFDCLIMATPISNIEQARGRICRYLPNKPEPIVIDVVDTGCEDLVKRAAWRESFYKEKGWKIDKKFI